MRVTYSNTSNTSISLPRLSESFKSVSLVITSSVTEECGDSDVCSVAPVTSPNNAPTVYRHTLEYTSTSLQQSEKLTHRGI